MLRSRRIAFAAAAVIIGLSGCGDAARTTSSGGAPVVIHLGASGATAEGASNAAGAPSADKMMMPITAFDFVIDGTLPDLGGTGTAWKLPVGQELDKARVAKIAAVLGVKGELRELPADQGGGWQIGSADYTAANLTVSPDGMVSWWFNPDPSVYGTSSATGAGCAVPTAMPDASPGDTSAATPETTAPATTDAPAPCEVVEPQPPTGVPNKDEALASTKAFLKDAGYDVAKYEFETYADEWGANVTAYLLLDGHRSPLTVSVGFGAEGAITWASGSLATPVQAGEYPLVGTQAGLDRLSDGAWMGYYGSPGMMAKGAADTTATRTVGGDAGAPAVGAPEPAPSDTVTSDSVLVDPMPVAPPACDPAADCVTESVPIEPITVHIDDAHLDLSMVWDVDGTVWLLPAYTFTSTDGGMYTVIAVDDQFVDLPEPTPIPDMAAPVDIDEATKVLVGVSESDAVAAGADLGWTVRVVTRDGETLAATDDYRTDRVNVSVTDGKVISVDSVG